VGCVISCKPHINSDCTTARRHRLPFPFFTVDVSSLMPLNGAKGAVYGDTLHPILTKSWLGYDFLLIENSGLTHFWSSLAW